MLIPFLYVKNVRYYQGKKIFSYLLNELIPILSLVYLVNKTVPLDFFYLWVAFWALYEVGYLMNDTYSSKFDSLDDKNKYKEIGTIATVNILIILIFRISIFLFITNFLLDGAESVDTSLFVIYLLMTMIAFFIHNIIYDKKYRLITISILGYSRYLIIPLALGVELSVSFLLVTPLVIIKLIDYSYEKFNSNVDIRNETLLRIIFYLIFFIPVYYMTENISYFFFFLPMIIFCVLKRFNNE